MDRQWQAYVKRLRTSLAWSPPRRSRAATGSSCRACGTRLPSTRLRCWTGRVSIRPGRGALRSLSGARPAIRACAWRRTCAAAWSDALGRWRPSSWRKGRPPHRGSRAVQGRQLAASRRAGFGPVGYARISARVRSANCAMPSRHAARFRQRGWRCRPPGQERVSIRSRRTVLGWRSCLPALHASTRVIGRGSGQPDAQAHRACPERGARRGSTRTSEEARRRSSCSSTRRRSARAAKERTPRRRLWPPARSTAASPSRSG